MGRFGQGRALLIAVGVLLALSACRKTVDTSVDVLSASGNRKSMDGTWFVCHDHSPNPDDGKILLVVGNAMTESVVDFTSTGGTCLTDQTLRWSASFLLTWVGDYTLAGWSDGSSVVSAPARLDGTGSLIDPPQVSLLDADTGASNGGQGAPAVGTILEQAWMIDDTGTPARLYHDTNLPSPACDPLSTTSAEGGCLSATDFLTQVTSLPGGTTQIALRAQPPPRPRP